METAGIEKGLSKLVGPAGVSTARTELMEFGENALARARPATADQVQRLVLWAREQGVKLVPGSSGPPHLHGSSVPRVPAVIVDLSGMNRILRVDRKNRVVMVEPGVRFDQLSTVLRAEGLRLPMPIFPRSAKSVLAACLEREPVTLARAQWDYMDPLCCLELVFGDGHLFRTGTAAGPGTLEQQWASGDAQKNNMGPSQADFGRLFQGAQGTLGIATWGSIRLEVLPSVHQLYYLYLVSLIVWCWSGDGSRFL